MVNIVDKYGLSEKEALFIAQDAMDFDFISHADDVTVTISTHEPCDGETWHPEFDVKIEGTSESDERSNGYFGYSYTRELLRTKMEEE